jgi:hypothetical protein
VVQANRKKEGGGELKGEHLGHLETFFIERNVHLHWSQINSLLEVTSSSSSQKFSQIVPSVLICSFFFSLVSASFPIRYERVS